MRVLRLFFLVVFVAPVGRTQSQPTASDSTAAPETVGRAEPVGRWAPLPLRSVREIAARRPGVRRDLATGTLVFRSALDREPVFVVDGARRLGGPLGDSPLALLGAPEGPFDAVETVDVLGAFVPASVGEASGGVVRVETAAGRASYGGRLEGLSSAGMDAFGTSIASATVRGPLGRVGGVSVTGEVRRQDDALPSAGSSVRLTGAARARVAASPQVVEVTDGSGATRFVPFPTAAALAALDAGQPFGAADVEATLPPGTTLVSPTVRSAAGALTEADLERTHTQDDPLRDLALTGQAELHPLDGVRLRVGGALHRRSASATAPTLAEAFGRRLFNEAGLSEQRLHATSGFASVESRLAEGATLFAQASAEATGSVLHPRAFSDDVADALRYGDTGDAANAVAQQYVFFRQNEYVRLYQEDGASTPLVRAFPGFSQPGAPASRYDRQSATSVQVTGRVTARVGTHRIEVGGEVERQTFRRFVLDGYGLARLAADGSVEGVAVGFPDGVERYEQLPFINLQPYVVATYGYTFNGTATTSGENVNAYFPDPTGRRADTDVAPFRPVTAAGYVRDRFEAGPASIDLGLRVSRYDARATTLFDPFVAIPILRAGALADRPATIGDDFAVYLNADGRTVGFRDRGGQFYDATGGRTLRETVQQSLGGSVVSVDALRSDAFTTTEAAIRVEPRVGVRLRASERLTLTGHAMRLTRRPDPSLYVPFSAYEELSGATFVPGNAALRPETVDAFGVGAEAVVHSTLTVAAEAFRRQRGTVAVPISFQSGFPSYVGVRDDGAVDETGLDLTAAWQPMAVVTLQGAYTVASARSATIIFPGVVLADRQPAAGDTRHAFDLALSVRLPDGAGVLGGVGIGLVASAQSGLPYSALQPPASSVFDPFTVLSQGTFNGARLPWTSQVDVRVERRFAVGPAVLTAFAWAENVLGTRNPLAVYRATGEPDDDGFLATIDGSMLTPSQRLLYAAYTSGPATVGGVQSTGAPAVYGRPRTVRLGVALGL